MSAGPGNGRGGRKLPDTEDLLAVHLSELGVEFERQYYYARPRKLRADIAITSARLLIEIQGGVFSRRAHGSVTGVLADIDRLNEATMHGWAVLRFRPDEVDDGTARAKIAEYLTAHVEEKC